MFKKNCFLIIVFFISTIVLKAQKTNRFAFGLNITHFNDWKSQSLNFFNPEINFSKGFNKHQFLYYSINVFYNTAKAEDLLHIGNILKRLIFTTDVGYRKIINNFSFVVGPSFRYRNERKIKYFYPIVDPFEFVTEPKKGYFDIGGFANIKYNVISFKKSNLQINASYHFYTRGVNPISLGLFYEKKF